MAIEVPRDKNIGNKTITKEIENYLLDKFVEDIAQPWTRKELISTVKRKFSAKFGDDLEAHVAWALDMLHFNKIVKRVAPGTFESADGPDEVYTERETGHASDGEYAHRGYDTRDTSRPKSKSDFSHELSKTDLSVKMLKNMGKDKNAVQSMLSSSENPFNPVALKLSLRKYYEGADIAVE